MPRKLGQMMRDAIWLQSLTCSLLVYKERPTVYDNLIKYRYMCWGLPLGTVFTPQDFKYRIGGLLLMSEQHSIGDLGVHGKCSNYTLHFSKSP